MEGQATNRIAIDPQRREREDRLGCYHQERETRPNDGAVEGAITAPGPQAAEIPAALVIAVADQLVLDELHERLGS